MARFRRFGVMSTALVLACLAAGFVSLSDAKAQSGKGKSKPKAVPPTDAKQIDARLEKLQATFEAESTAIIEGYEKAGQYERAKFLLEVLLKLDPANENVKKRIAQNEDHIHERVEFDQRFDVSSGWTLVGHAFKDQPARVSATGEFKLNISASGIGPNGFPSDDITQDLQSDIPTGALMGMIVTEASLREKKAPQPFAIKAKHEFTPKEDGHLYLRINVPPGSKCTGDLKLKISGIAQTS